MEIKELLADKSNYDSTYRTSDKIKYIVIHYTANNGDRALGNCNYFRNNKNLNASAHYFVDQDEVYRSVPDNCTAWSVGANKYVHPYARNSNTLNIELCSRMSNGKYYFLDETVDNAVELTKELMERYNIPIENVIRHYDVTGKNCLPVDSTELLTRNGWVNLANINVGDEIVAYDSNTDTMIYNKVKDVVKPYMADVLRVSKLEATLDHNIYRNFNRKDSFLFKKAKFEDFINNITQWKIKSAGQMINPGINLTDNEIRLLVWIQGDGSYDGDAIRFHLRKERKIYRLTKLLDNLGIKYRLGNRKDGTKCIDIRDKGETKSWTDYWLSNKEFTFKLLDMNKNQVNVFLTELTHVDGSIENNSYFSMHHNNTDAVQALCAINNIRTCLYCAKNNLNVVGMVDKNYYVISNKRPGEKQSKKSTRNTLVSCVTVDTGLILIRQHGRTSIVGNCPAPMVQDVAQWNEFKNRLNGDDLTMGQYNEIMNKLNEMQSSINDVLATNGSKYNNINDVPDWADSTVNKLVNKGYLADPNALDMSYNMLRILVILDRSGAFDNE